MNRDVSILGTAVGAVVELACVVVEEPVVAIGFVFGCDVLHCHGPL